MPASARKDLVREGEIATYHVWSRCVQRAWLCGRDPLTGQDYGHRRDWIESLLEYLAGVFAVDVGNYHLLANHLHAILCTRPDIARAWSDDEVAYRWKMAWPRLENDVWARAPTDEEIEELLQKGSEHIEKLRANLASLSWIMARWKEPIAKAANRESERRGHYWEQRFGSRELTDDGEIFTAMLYNDLQQVRAGSVASLEASDHSAFQRRFRAWRAEQAQQSLEAFRRGGREGDDRLDAGMLEDLLAASWLAPISSTSPLLHVADSITAAGPVADAAPKLHAPAGPESPGDDAEREAASAEASSSPSRGRRGRRRSRHTIHARLRRRLRARRDRAILRVSWSSYYEVAKEAEADWRRQAHPTQQLMRAAPSVVPEAASPTATPTVWRADVRDFRRWLTNLPGDPARWINRLRRPRGDPD